MKNLKIFFFLVVFCLDLKLKAGEPGSGSADVPTTKDKDFDIPTLQSPENCYKKSFPCSVSSGHQPKKLKHEGGVIHLDRSSIVEFRGKNDVVFLSGIMGLKAAGSLKLQIQSGVLEVGEGEVWVLEESSRIVVRSVVGDTELQMGKQGKLSIPEGFQVWVSGKNEEGEIFHGVPELIPLEDHLKVWNRNFSGPKAEFINQVNDLKQRYKPRTELSSEIYQDVVDRQVASERERETLREQINQRKMKELRERRQHFYERTFER